MASDPRSDPSLLKKDPNFVELKEGETPEWDYDEANPEFLLGKEVSILWADSRVWYKGKIDNWDEKDGKHHISYEDNDKRWHRLIEYSFSLYGMRGQHVGEKQDEPYRRKFIPYTPKDPDSKTVATFHCTLDAKWMEAQPPNTQVCIKGTLAELGTWEGTGVPMTRDPADPSSWSADIELPFSLGESCNTGIFEWKFGIMLGDDVILEGGLNHRVKQCRRHYYMRFKPNRKGGKKSPFRGYKTPTIKDTLEAHVLRDFKQLTTGKYTAVQFLDRLEGLHQTIKGTRSQSEAIVEEALKSLPDHPGAMGTTLFALLAVVGRFGVSIDETTEVEEGGKKVKRKKVLKPSTWCWFAQKNLNLETLCLGNLKELMGPRFRWCLLGLAEAASRNNMQADLSWARVAPLLMQHKQLPRPLQAANAGIPHVFKPGDKVRCNYKKKGRWYTAQIMEKSDKGTFFVVYNDGDQEDGVVESQLESIRGSSKEAIKARKELEKSYGSHLKPTIELAMSTLAMAQTMARASEGKEEKEAQESAEGVSKMGVMWLEALVKYAPCTAALAKLFEDPRVVGFAPQLVGAVANWVGSAEWEMGELARLHAFLGKCPGIGSPQTAEMLFKADTTASEDMKMLKMVVGIVGLCCNPHSIDFEQKGAAPAGADAKVPQDDGKGAKEREEIIKAFARMDSAAYIWFKKCFSEKPVLEERRLVQEGFVSKWVTVEKSDKEQQVLCLRTLADACDIIDNLMAVTYFAKRPQSILFELDRCRFLKGTSKGEPTTVLKTLTQLGAKHKLGFERYARPLADFLSRKCTKILHEVVPFVKNDAKRLMKVLTAVDELPRKSDLSHKLVHTLLASAGTTDLQGILNNCTLWKLIFTTRGVPKGDGAGVQETPLIALLRQARDELMSAANSVLPLPGSLDKLAKVSEMTQQTAQKLMLQGFDDLDFMRSNPSEDQWIAHCGISPAEAKSVTRSLRSFGGATMKTMHIVASRRIAFMELLKMINHKTLTEGKLSSLLMEVNEFDTMLEQTKFFLSFYCNCGVRINVDQLQRTVSEWSMRYDTLQLAKVRTLFRNLLTPDTLKSFAWLYSARTSTLFLNMWTDTGKALVRTIDKRNRQRSAGFASGGLGGVPPPPPAGPFGGDAKMGQQEGKADQKFALIDEMQITYRLTQKEVLEKLIPSVRRKWQELKNLVKTCSITVPQLEKTFAVLPTDEHYASELVVLARTGDGKGQGETGTWVNESMLKLKDFSMLLSMKNSLPAILRLRSKVLPTLFKTGEDTKTDVLFTQLTKLEQKLKEEWSKHTLKSLSALVGPVKKELGAQLTSSQLKFITILAEESNDAMTKWLLKQKNQGEFNQWRQFATDTSGEANVLNAVASTVALRTTLLKLLYQRPPFANLKAFMDCFRTEVEMNGVDTLLHLKTVSEGFGLLQRGDSGASSGVKACKDVIHYLNHGVLVFRANVDHSKILSLAANWDKKEKTGKDQKVGEAKAAVQNDADSKEDDFEYLLDLRSKLVMTEIPKRLEEEFKMSSLISSFLDQLHVALDIKDQIHSLHQGGHFLFQEGYAMELKLGAKALPSFHKALRHLNQEMLSWTKTVKEARQKFYFLNFFTMRELIKIICILNGKARAQKEALLRKEQGDRKQDGKEGKGDSKEEIYVPPEWNCPACTATNKMEYVFCMMCTVERPKKWSILLEKNGGKISKGKPRRARTPPRHREERAPYDSVLDLVAMLHLVASHFDEANVKNSFSKWCTVLNTGVEQLEKSDSEMKEKTNKFKLETLGNMLHELLEGSTLAPPQGGDQKSGKKGGGVPMNVRRIPPPGRDAKNSSDLIISLAEEEKDGEEKRLPIYVACAKSPQHVIEVVLSVFVRRSRLPEPGEILFCNERTSVEDIDLLFYRFLNAKKHNRGHFVFTVADVHALTYTQQVAVLDRLREVIGDTGMDNAANLLFVSGKPRQVLLNSLSAHMISLEALDEKTLQYSLKYATNDHCGQTLCVSSAINGAGKTSYILKEVGMMQAQQKPIAYRRVAYHESSTSGTLVDRLSRFASNERCVNAFHLHIGHIIPANANTCLFELLIVGVLKNNATCDVYHRSKRDVFYLEIPNSSKDKTATALRFCKMLPTQRLRVDGDSLSWVIPLFRNPPLNTRIRLQLQPFSTDPMVYTVNFLKAFKEKKFQMGGAQFDPSWDPNMTQPPDPREAFALLREYTENKRMPGDEPSFILFDNFSRFMKDAFLGMDPNYGFEPLKPVYVSVLQGLESLRNAFCSMLIATSKDFALRAVPRGRQYGRALTAAAEMRAAEAASRGGGGGMSEEEQLAMALSLSMANAGAGAGGGGAALVEDLPPALPSLNRTPSAELRMAKEAAAPPALGRQNSNEMAERFTNMMKWDDTDHPVCLWYANVRQGHGYEGLDILSLNKTFTAQYISRGLLNALNAAVPGGFKNLTRDWQDMKSEEGIEILRKVEGYALKFGATDMKIDRIDPTYVITIDNLLKMLSIQLRLKNGLPVVIMGETGCGKSSLIRQLCAILNLPLRILNIHGGMSAGDVVAWIQRQVKDCELLTTDERVVVLLDEVNTCNCMGLFKEIVCDRSVQGRFLPDNMKIIAACNPYRLKSKEALREEGCGLVFDHFDGKALGDNVATGISDPLKNLVYRVHPLPESMIDHVFDFGALPPETENIYIRAMLKRQLGIYMREEEQKDKKVDEKGGGDAKKQSEKDRIKALMEQAIRGSKGGMRSDYTAQAAHRTLAQLIAQRRAADQAAIGAGGGGGGGDFGGFGPGGGTPAQPPFGGGGGGGGGVPFGGGPFGGGAGAGGGGAGAGGGTPSVTQEEMKKMMEDIEKSSKEDGFVDFVEVFAELICKSQEFVRNYYNGERSVVSLRDVARCVKVFRWFGEHFAKYLGAHAEEKWDATDFFNVKPCARECVRSAMIMSLAYCFHARLDRKARREYGMHLQRAWERLQEPIGYEEIGTLYAALFGGTPQRVPKYGPRCTWLELNAGRFSSIVSETMRSFVSHLKLGKGIALNEALLENLFMIMISVLNRIPIFVVGKPGTSKSLAMGLIQANMNGEASENDFLRALPAVEVFSYQCSPLSTSAGIQQAFDSARRYKMQSPNVITVVLLDEVGLAEQSPHLPLKVLHKVLDEGGDYALVGISNWSLDPAKMNRAVHLYRPAPTVEDLSRTAEGMVQSAMLEGFLRQIAKAYNKVYENQRQRDFWGLREFYSTVKHINRALTVNKGQTLDGAMLMNSIQRNFGGKPEESKRVINVFFETLGMQEAGIPRLDTTKLISQNIQSSEARHLMLLTKNNAALRLLFDYGLREHETTDVIFGSDFPLDKTDLQICLNLQTLKTHMAHGRTVVLVYCEALYESLYDLLNQHYTEFGGKLYVRLAFGTSNKLCEIHKNFRVIVIVEKIDAYNRLAPPLLNRFEKQVMERKDLLSAVQREVVKTLTSFAAHFSTGKHQAKAKVSEMRGSFVGFHSDYISSLVQSMEPPEEMDQFTLDCLERLLWLATPEAACRVLERSELKLQLQQNFGVDVVDLYFKRQRHSDMVDFAKTMLDEWSDAMGSQIVLLTFSPITLQSGAILSNQSKWKDVTVCTLHELSTERDLKQAATEFFATAKPGSVFLLQCDPQAGSVRRIEHAKYILEKLRAQHAKTYKPSESKAAPSTPTARDMKEREAKGASSEAKDSPAAGEGKDAKEQPVAAAAAADKKQSDAKQQPEKKQAEAKETAGTATGGESSAEPSKEEAAEGIHVVVLVHLPRRDGKFLIDLDKRWRYAFIDDVEPAGNTGLPNIQSMLDTSLRMVDICKTLNLQQVLLTSFRQALARLAYLHPRTNEDVRKQIGFLLRTLRSDKQFLQVIETGILDIIAQSNARLDVTRASKSSEELAIAGTFQAALHRQILDAVSSAFARMLAHADRNAQLLLLEEQKGQLRNFWLSLFSRSIKDLQVLNYAPSAAPVGGGDGKAAAASGSAAPTVVEVASDGTSGQAFVARFPFSFFVFKVLQEFGGLTENAKDPVRALQQQFMLMNLDHGLDGPLPVSTLRRYVYDFTCMRCKFLQNISRDSQAEILWKLLKLLNQGKDIALLSEVHSLFPKVTRILEEVFGLVTAVPPAVGGLIDFVTKEAKAFGPDLELELVRLVIDVLSPTKQGWAKITDYMNWMIMFEDVRPVIDGILTFASQELAQGKAGALDAKVAPDAKQEHTGGALATKLVAIQARWEKLLFVYTFLRDVSLPIRVEPVATLKTLAPILDSDKAMLRTSATFRAVVKMFSELRFKIINPSDDFICPITLEPFKEPVILVGDGRTYERAAIEEWLQTHDTAPMTNLPLQTKELRPNVQLEAKAKVLASEESLTKAASRFMEFYIFGLCFGERVTMDMKLLTDFTALLAGKKLGKTSIDVMPSEAGRVGLLRCLLNHPDAKLKKQVSSLVLKALAMTVKRAKYLDTNLAVHYASVHEHAHSTEILTAQDAIPAMNEVSKNLGLFEKKNTPPHELLRLIAKTRCILSLAAQSICQSLNNEEKNAEAVKESAMVKLLCNQLEKLLLLPSPMQRPIRMFFLKNLERARGTTFLRSAMQQPPLGSSKWVKEWRESGEAGLIRFLGSGKLPRNNPFKGMPYFSDVDNAIAASIAPTATDFPALSRLVANVRGKRKEECKLKGALVAGAFHECFLLAALPEIPKLTKSRLDELAKWVLQSEDLSFMSPTERAVVAFFCLDDRKATEEGRKFMMIDSKSSAERIMLVRLAVHTCAVALASDEDDVGRLFHTMITNPGALAGTWLPCMVEDVTAMAVAALGGRWYRCSNGHAYYVDNCGLPMQVLKCATCGVKIGGKDHVPLAGQKDLDGKLQGKNSGGMQSAVKDNSEPNYCIKAPKDAKSPFETVRGLTPTANRALRLFIHSALVMGSVVGGSKWEGEVKKICNKAYVSTSNHAKYFAEHLENDYKTLVKLVRKSQDDLCLLLHACLSPASMSDSKGPAVTLEQIIVMMRNPQVSTALTGLTQTLQMEAQGGYDPDGSDDEGPDNYEEKMNQITQLKALLRMGRMGGMGGMGAMARLPPGALAQFEAQNASLCARLKAVVGPVLEGLPPQAMTMGMVGMGGVPIPMPMPANAMGGGVDAKGGAASRGWGRCPAPQRRTMWEKIMSMKIDPWFESKTLGQKIESAKTMFSTDENDEGSVFMAELQEKVDVRSMNAKMRASLCPALWRYRAPFSLEDFTMELNLQEDNKDKYPVLTHFLAEEPTLRALRFLPSAIEFVTLVLGRYNRAIDRESARKLTIEEMINTAANKKKWVAAFEGYREAWNTGWRFVERFGCLELPKVYKDVRLDAKQPITFCLPQEKNEGICALSLINYLCTRHNQFVEIVYERLLMQGGNMQRIEDRKSVVTSNFFSHAHAITYSLEKQFAPFIAKNCVTFTDDGRVVYDFANAEQYLLDVFFTGKPLVKIKQRMMQYTDDEGAVNTRLFRQKVEQVALTREEKKTILNELGSPAAAHKLKGLVEMCISYLQSTGGNLLQKLDVAEVKLAEYVKDTLLMENAVFGSETVKRKMKLKHIDSLHKALREFTVADVFENVHAKYKDTLDSKQTTSLKDSAKALNLEVLLPLMQDVIAQTLSDGVMSEKGSIADFIGWLEHEDSFLNDFPWFEKFPKQLLMRNICDCYRVLENCQSVAN